jgi:hypothetical protein
MNGTVEPSASSSTVATTWANCTPSSLAMRALMLWAIWAALAVVMRGNSGISGQAESCTVYHLRGGTETLIET